MDFILSTFKGVNINIINKNINNVYNVVDIVYTISLLSLIISRCA